MVVRSTPTAIEAFLRWWKFHCCWSAIVSPMRNARNAPVAITSSTPNGVRWVSAVYPGRQISSRIRF